MLAGELVCEGQARALIRRCVTFLTPRRKCGGADPDSDDDKTGLCQLFLHRLSMLQPGIKRGRHHFWIAEQRQQFGVLVTMIPRQRDRNRTRHLFALAWMQWRSFDNLAPHDTPRAMGAEPTPRHFNP